MQETLSFFMFLLQVKDKNVVTKDSQWRREKEQVLKLSYIFESVFSYYSEHSILVYQRI